MFLYVFVSWFNCCLCLYLFFLFFVLVTMDLHFRFLIVRFVFWGKVISNDFTFLQWCCICLFGFFALCFKAKACFHVFVCFFVLYFKAKAFCCPCFRWCFQWIYIFYVPFFHFLLFITMIVHVCVLFVPRFLCSFVFAKAVRFL